MKKLRMLIGLAILFLSLTTPVWADLSPGALDTGFDTSSGSDNYVYSVAQQHDGKVLIGGNFTMVDGTSRSRIARLNADGSIDNSFNPGSGANGWVVAVAPLPDGKVLIGGNFTQVSGTPFNSIARLDADGSLDTSYNPGGATFNGSSGWVFDFAVQDDGKVLIAGDFTELNGTTRNNIGRLTADGSLDTGFTPDSISSRVKAMAQQSDGKVLIGGWFTTVGGTARNYIARLNAGGTLDYGFDPGSGANNWVESVAIQDDGKIIIGGPFTQVNGVTRNHIARLNSNGTLDSTFNPSTGPNGSVDAIGIQPDGRLMVAGVFTQVSSTARNYIARLNTDGSLDTSFDPGSGPNNWLVDTVVQADGKVLIGGVFTQVDGTPRKYIARLNADGSLDTGFDTSTGANYHVLAAAIIPNGKVIIGGNFTVVKVTILNYIARLNANGSLDMGFNPGSGADGLVEALAVQDDGKVIIGGWFTHVNGVPRNHIARLNVDGSLDTGFNTSTGPDSWISTLALQTDGKVLIGGLFTHVDGVPRNFIARLKSDGTLDNSFSPGSGTDDWVRTLALQSNGKVIIGGWFNSVDGWVRKYIARLNSDGSLDTSFDPGAGANAWVEAVAVQDDGKVVIGGFFTLVNNQPRNRIERLNANGSLDATFNTSTGADDWVASMKVQPDGKILIGGGFTTYAGVSRSGIARLNANGSLDTGFNPGTGTNGVVRTIAIQTDGKVIIGGQFTQVNGVPRNYIARLNGATPPTFTSAAPSGPVTLVSVFSHTFTASGFPKPTFQVSSGRLPPGLSLDATSGVLVGTFTARGIYNFTVTASNWVAPSVTQDVIIMVSGGGQIVLPLIVR